jgi:hypothetical protein
MDASKIEMYVIKGPEPESEIYYKIEGSNNPNVFMIAYYKAENKERAFEHFWGLLSQLIGAQEKKAGEEW